MTNVGSKPAAWKMEVMRLVVVVLPCVPATAMPCRWRISSPNMAARGTTGTRCSPANLSSGFVSSMALDATTASASPAARPSWPRATGMPNPASRSVMGVDARSEPVTS